MRRFGMFLTAALPLFAAILIQYIVVNGIMFAYSFYLGLKESLGQTADGTPGDGLLQATEAVMSQETLYLLSVAGIIVCGIVFFFWYRIEIRGELRGSFKDVITAKYISLFALLGIGCQFFFSGILGLLTPLFIQLFTDYSEVLQNLTSGSSSVVLLLMVLIAPVAEELIFRGVILHIANRYVTFLGANILQAVLFGVYHENIVQGIYAALLGFLLGMVYQKFKSIFAPVILHMFINISSFLLYLFPGTKVSYIIILIGGVIFAAIALYLIKPTKRVPLNSTPIE